MSEKTDVAMRDLELRAYREIWNDIRSHSSNIWQIAGLTLVALAFCFDVFWSLLGDVTRLEGDVLGYIQLSLTLSFGFLLLVQYGVYNLNERIKECIQARQYQERHYVQVYTNSLEQQDLAASTFRPISERLSWMHYDRMWSVVLFGILFVFIAMMPVLRRLFSICGWGSDFFVPLMTTIILFPVWILLTSIRLKKRISLS